MQLLDGKVASASLLAQIKQEVNTLTAQGHRPPHLVAVLVGNDGASKTYVASKEKRSREAGFTSTVLYFDENMSQAQLLAEIDRLNDDHDVDGFIVQLPLPRHIDADRVTLAINPDKDVDGFHPENLGRMAKGWPCFLPATPFGILKLLQHFQIETAGKHCVIIGRSQIVGLPMAILMQRNEYPGNCTVTLTHSRTANLKEMVAQGDIIVAALGKPEFVTADMVKPGAVVIDVGITRVEDASNPKGFVIKGDVKFDEVAEKASWITPVPGGVGLMTIACLLDNTLQAWKRGLGVH